MITPTKFPHIDGCYLTLGSGWRRVICISINIYVNHIIVALFKKDRMIIFLYIPMVCWVIGKTPVYENNLH
jgi:hypothetical protein